MGKNTISSTTLEALLCLGGDERLVLDPVTGVNIYNCSPCPERSTALISFASSTASSISRDAFAHLTKIQDTLNAYQDPEMIDEQLDAIRQELLNYFGLESENADIVFVPSGTDAILQSVFLTRALSPISKTLISIVLAADESASRVAAAASGRHFNSMNPRGEPVTKGSIIADFCTPETTNSIRLIELSRAECREETNLEEIVDSFFNYDGKTHVLLHAMDTSKMGTRTPSMRCLERIEQRHGNDALTILIDACQFRLSPRRMREHIAHGRLVIITGSKFLTGPAFSGAIVVPALFRSQLQRVPVNSHISREMASYTTIFDWPRTWINMRRCLIAADYSSPVPNMCQFLRWIAAAFELRRYVAVPTEERVRLIIEIGIVIRIALSSVPDLIEPLDDETRSCVYDECDEEFRHPTIFPFLVRQRGEGTGFLNYDACKLLYHKLCVLTNNFPVSCLIGQPVALKISQYQEPVAALRLALDVRMIADEFERRNSADGMSSDVIRAQVETAINKITVLVNELQM
jgi:hypothetical protein